MKEGLGEIAIDFSAELRRGGPERKLVFDNLSPAARLQYIL